MNSKGKLRIVVVALVMAGFVSSAVAVSDSDIETSFFPYAKGVPVIPGLQVGSVINKGNVSRYKELLDDATFKFIENGWHDVEIGATSSIALHPNYIALSKKNADQAKLGDQPGTIENYKGGRPFPYDPDPKDPRAGEKLAFNFKYSQIAGDAGRIFPFYWDYRNMATGQLERTISFDFHFLNYKYRSVQSPMPGITPNTADLYRAIYARVLEPQDLKNTQILIQRFDNDTKLDDSYLYLGFQRRVRRLATGQTTDSFLGSDLMIQDFEGFNARVQDMQWKYKGVVNILLPVYNHSELKQTDSKFEDGYGMVTFGGKSECFPNIPWSVRKAYVLETTPTDPGSPVGKRVMYMDAQTMQFPVILIYDKKGELWKRWVVGFSDADKHAPANKGAGIAVYTSASMADVQAHHCTTLKLRMISEAGSNPPNLFTVQNMRGGD